jgi:DNA-binding IclR family transcriptional regulator
MIRHIAIGVSGAPMSKKGSEVQSLSRAIAVLRVFTPDTPELGVTDISRRVGLHKSTTFRLLSTLAAEGLIAQNPESGQYRLGMGLIALAGRVAVHTDLRQTARRHIRPLADRLGGTVNIAVLDRGESFNLEQSVPRGYLVVNYGWVGRRTPLHATSTGKVLLAWLPPDEIGGLLPAELPSYTPQTITSHEALRDDLVAVRERGYAIGHEEYEVGLNAVAAPVCDASGDVVAALSISGPAYRLSPGTFERVAADVIAVAEGISGELGHLITQPGSP